MQKEFSLAEIFILLLRRFKRIAAGAVAFALVFGFVGGIRELSALENPKTTQQAQEDYLKAREEYENTSQQLEQQLLTARQEEEALSDYTQNSLYYQLDSSQVAVKEIVFYVDTGYQIQPQLSYQTPDMTGRIVSAYTDAYRSQALSQVISEILNLPLEDRYLLELVEVQRAGDTKVTDANGNVTVHHSDLNNSIVVLRGRYSDQTTAGRIADSCFSLLQQQVKGSVAPHEVRVLSSSSYTQQDQELAALQTDTLLRQRELTAGIATAAAQLEQLELTPPQAPTFSKRSVAVKAALYAVAGGVIGGAILCAATVVAALTDSRLGEAGNLTRLFSLELLGSLPAALTEEQGAPQRQTPAPGREPRVTLLHRLEGRAPEKPLTRQESLALLRANLSAFASRQIAAEPSGPVSLLLTGSVDGERLLELCNALGGPEGLEGITLCSGPNLLAAAATVEQLSRCDAVVLVEDARTSRIGDIQRQLDRIRALGKPVLGAVYLER